MIDLEKIKRRLEMRFPDGFVGVAVDSGAQWVKDIRALVAEVERLQEDIIDVCLCEIALSARLERATSLIGSVEWTYKSGGGSGALCCVFCRGLYPDHELDCKRQMVIADDLQLCGHPRSAIVSSHDLGGDGCTGYCDMCEAEAEVRRDDRMIVDPELGSPLEMREEEVRY